ncbi:Fis family transcriptional regulator [Lampropedia cohaerens]|uniref:Fis family transcriptional regulator n=1 Tax=Lampropedia cohaerens TaxID=1610491 RepID=A0A0U1PYX3_9BURK|nr:response regulator [Lampropedia cohaerens]KKW67722.1 Fis family transcriptional regulator [Lampropedia cohaerens]
MTNTLPLRILAVDDSPSMRRMVCYTLEAAGYAVVEAVDGEDALQQAQQHDDIALVLADQNMPRLDGLGLTRRLRAMPAYASTPILILTTESGDDIKQAGRAAGATGWLVKPFDPVRLVDVIRRVTAPAARA